jgi:hypothetical protein
MHVSFALLTHAGGDLPPLSADNTALTGTDAAALVVETVKGQDVTVDLLVPLEVTINGQDYTSNGEHLAS